jgi:hypothetical protein
LVAGELGFRLLDRGLVDLVAKRAGASPEVARKLDERSFGWATGLVYSVMLALEGQPINQQSYRYIVELLMREFAEKEDLVVLGRASQAVLGSRPDVFNVRIIAPIEDRVARVAASEQKSLTAARRRIHEIDEGRRQNVWEVARRDWGDPGLYDLVVNTHRLGPEDATSLIVDGARRSGVLQHLRTRSAVAERIG